MWTTKEEYVIHVLIKKEGAIPQIRDSKFSVAGYEWVTADHQRQIRISRTLHGPFSTLGKNKGYILVRRKLYPSTNVLLSDQFILK